MRKCKCWQVRIFPQKSWFSQKLHSTILKILQCFTKPDRPSSESPAALPAGARDAWHDLSAIRLLKRSQLSSLCSIAFFQCPLCLSQCHWRHLGDQTELHLAVLGEISSVSLTVMFARLAGWQLVVPGKSSSTARLCLKMWGICLNTAFHQTLDFFSEAVRSSNCCPFVPPFRYYFFLFHISAMQGKPSSLPWSGSSHGFLYMLLWGSGYEAHHWTSELLLRLPVLHQGSNLESFPHLSCLTKCQHFSGSGAGEQCGTHQVQPLASFAPNYGLGTRLQGN